MPRFFVETDAVVVDNNTQGTEGDLRTIRITGEDAHHITHVLRTRIGEKLTVCDDHGTVYETELVEPGTEVLLRVLDSYPADTEPPYRATVYQGLAKGDKMETVIQKAVEIGAWRIVPVATSRSVVKLDEKDARKKVERWQKIAHEAAKQCGRGIIPVVAPVMSYKEAVQEAATAVLPLFCYEGEGTRSMTALCRDVDMPDTVSICIGPEGGFSEEEANYAADAGMRLCGLGKRILRTETASGVVLACLSAFYEM